MSQITISADVTLDVSDVLPELDTLDMVQELVNRDAEREFLDEVHSDWLLEFVSETFSAAEVLESLPEDDIAEYAVRHMGSSVVSSLSDATILTEAFARNELADLLFDVPSGDLIKVLSDRGVNLGIPDEVLAAAETMSDWIRGARP